MSPPEGEVFSHIALSFSTTAVTTDAGECHVMQHIDNEVQKFRLATSDVEKIYASGDTLAILHTPWLDGTQVPLTIYMIKSRQVVHCRARSKGFPLSRDSYHLMNIMIGPSEDYLVLFEQWNKPEETHHFAFTRFNLDGQIHSQGSLQEPIKGHIGVPRSFSTALDADGCTTIWSYRTSSYETVPIRLIRIQYDPQQNKLQLKTNQIKLKSTWSYEKAFFWKDVAYLRDQCTTMS